MRPGVELAVGGRRIRVFRAGDASAPTALVFGGLGSVPADWNAVGSCLGQAVQLVWLEGVRPGGAHPEPLPTTVSATKDAAQSLGIPAPYVVVGHSLGGVYAQAFARLYPELTRGIVLVDSSIRPTRERRVPLPLARGARALARLSPVFGRLARRLTIWSTTTRGKDPVPTGEAADWYRDVTWVGSLVDEWSRAAHLFEELSAVSRAHSWPDVATTVLVGGSHGRPFTRPDRGWIARQGALAAELAGSRLIVVREAAHMVPIDRPQAVADAILEMITPK
jgi:pimeloyl-ACP methyl ester carboxylesterase